MAHNGGIPDWILSTMNTPVTRVATDSTGFATMPRPRKTILRPQEFETQMPRRGLKLSGIAILGLLALLVIGDQFRLYRPDHKFQLVVEVETPSGVKSASNVLSVTPNRGYGGSNTGESAG